MQIEVIQTRSQFDSLRDKWNRLAKTPMQSHEWLSTWWEVYQAPHRQLQSVIAKLEGEVVAVAPLYIETGRFGERWRLLGDGKVCSDHSSLLFDLSHQAEATRALVDWLRERDAYQRRPLHLESIDSDESALCPLVNALQNAGYLVNEQEQPGSAFVDLPETWDEYLTSVSKNHRKRCRRWDKEYFQSTRAKIEVATKPDHCLAAWTTLVELHNTRRAELGQAGAFEDPLFTDFHRQVIPKLAAAGKVQLRILHVDSQPAAAEYLLTDERCWYAYQSGMSAAGQELGAGSLSIMAVVRDAIAAGCTKFDLLRGAEPYKFSWGARHRPAATVTVRSASIANRLATLSDTARSAARQVKSKLVSR